MLEFKDGDIILTRGDSVYIDTVILTPCEEVYEPRDKDEVYLYIIKKNEISRLEEEKESIWLAVLFSLF